MIHTLRIMELETLKFIEVYQNENSNETTITLEVGFYEENGEKSNDTLGDITLNKKELHSLIGTLLHVQSKMK